MENVNFMSDERGNLVRVLNGDKVRFKKLNEVNDKSLRKEYNKILEEVISKIGFKKNYTFITVYSKVIRDNSRLDIADKRTKFFVEIEGDDGKRIEIEKGYVQVIDKNRFYNHNNLYTLD